MKGNASVDEMISEDMQIMLRTVRRFVERDLEPVSRRVEEEDRLPPEIVEKMRELGLFGLSIPQEYGGLGLSTFEECLVYEEMGRTNACFRTYIGTNNGIGSHGIIIDGTEEQKTRFLPLLASGEWIGCFALSEPEAGSDAGNVQTSAVRDGDAWILNGRKHFITNGDVADLSTVFAVTDREKKTHGGITAFLVEDGFPGFSRGPSDRKMGHRGSHTCELIFEDCRVPAENVLGGEPMIGQGFKTAMKILDKGRLTMGAVAVGAARHLLDLCLAHARQRVQFGRPIGQFQLIQGMLADMATQIHAGTLMLHDAARLRDTKGQVVKEASMVKLFCTEMACRVADMAVQIHGGMGYMQEYPIERYFRDLRLTRIYEGTSEIQRIVIARELLKE